MFRVLTTEFEELCPAVLRVMCSSTNVWCGALTMAKDASLSARPAAARLLPLRLLAAPAFAQTEGKEDSVILQPDKVKDDAPIVAVRIEMPSWPEGNATALLSFLEKVGAEGLFARDYTPDGLAAAILGGHQRTAERGVGKECVRTCKSRGFT